MIDFKALFSASLLLLTGMGTAYAQRIDLDNGSRKTADGFSSWVVKEGREASARFGNLQLTLSTSADCRLKSNWWKDGVNKYNRCINDGVTVQAVDDSRQRKPSSGGKTIRLTVSGLSPGRHSLQAYHNYVDGEPSARLPLLAVKVDGRWLLRGIAQSQRAEKASAAGRSYVEFSVKRADRPIVIEFATIPERGESYTNTGFYINSLEFDVTAADRLAHDPYPTDGDFHAAADSGITFRWQAAKSASAHICHFGTDSLTVADGTGGELLRTASFTRRGLSPLKTYYWRVDEVIDGVTYKGKVWSFRPRRDAFPGAEGYGRYAIGGRGGMVYHVTSLDDDPINPVPGTFRYGISRLHGPRTIVFDVGGVIALKSRLTCSDRFVTIAGQTAPGLGIMLRSHPFGMAGDGITRFLRLRLGHEALHDRDGLDGMGMAGNDHSIMDHCSISWTIDEAFSSRNARHITLQRTLISETLNVAGHPNYGKGMKHGYSATIGGGEGGAQGSSFHHNLLAHNEGRNWSMSGGLDGSGAYDGHHDMFNNVVYNWGHRACDGGTHEGQFVANYYKMGPATTQPFLLVAQLEGTGSGTQSYFVAGNLRENRDGSLTRDREGETYRYTLSHGQKLSWEVFRRKPFFPSLARVETAETAYRSVLSDVGCNVQGLDNHDRRMIRETLLGTASTTGSFDGVADGLIDSETDKGCEGFDGLDIAPAVRPTSWDTDGDGIPDWFERARGWDASTPNNNADSDGNSYTDLEDYLNWMALPHFIGLHVGEKQQIALATYFAGFPNGRFAVIPSAGVDVTIKGSLLTFTPRASGLSTLEVTATQDGVSFTRSFNLHVAETVR